MRRLLPLLLLLASGCASTRSTATHADGPFAGPWLMTVRPVIPVGIGDVRTVLYVDPDGEAFEAHSRSGAVRDLVGGVQATLAPLVAGEAVRRGALLHLYDGRAVARGDSVAVTARLVSRGFSASPMLSAGIAGRRLRGTLRGANGVLIATVEAVPFTGALPVQDYPALLAQARDSVAVRFHDPRELATPAWTDFWSDADRRMARAQDDLEAMAQFRMAASALDVSHFGLFRPAIEMPDDGAGTGVSFERRPDGVAVLTCLDFVTSQAAPVVEQAFADMEARPPSALVLDLRECSGGDFSSMSVAAHLVRAPMDAGVFVSNAWWASHDALPARDTWAALPTLSAPDLPTFFREVGENGALAGRLVPAAPRYDGPVFVLTSENTGSAAEPLASLLKTSGRATLVGATTAGAMLASQTVDLPQGWVVTIPVADYVTAEGVRLEGTGVAPTVAVEPDEALERALALPR